MSAASKRRWLTLVTTPSYAAGVVALSLSLEAVGSRARLLALTTNAATRDAILAEASRDGFPRPQRLDVLVMDGVELPASASAATHGARGATLAVDAPRRALWALGASFALLDADLIALQNPDVLLDLLDDTASGAAALHAVPAFRLKKQSFGAAAEGGGFNAGVLLVRDPAASDARELAALVEGAGDDDTEESLLNKLFRGRWSELPRGFNVPKRVLVHAPKLWRELVSGREVVFLHYLGAKPWMSDANVRRGADWEAERPEYAALEGIWGQVRKGVAVAADGTLLHLLAGLDTPVT